MKFLFIVQGEGRGHLTQALTLEEMLLKNGHEVVEVLVGKSSTRMLPGFFNRNIHAPVKRFLSPNFLPDARNKRVNLGKSIAYNLTKIPVYLSSINYIRKRIEKSGADVVINFYELLTGLTYAFFRPSVPYVCVGHQYLFLHHDFEFPRKRGLELFMLRFFTRLTSIHSTRRLALSFREMGDAPQERLSVIPPLLRAEVFSLQPEEGNYIPGYMVNAGFAESVTSYHAQRPDVKLHFFWDDAGSGESTEVSPNLHFHQLDDLKFLDYMNSCRAYTSTAGFESICEAMYLGKPIMMVPAHIEQDCNAHDAVKAGAGIVSDSFDLDKLLEYAETHQPDKGFISWVKSCERLIINELVKGMNQTSVVAYPTSSNVYNYETK